MNRATKGQRPNQYGSAIKSADANPFRGWKAELDVILDEHNRFKGRGDRKRIASNRTQEERELVLFRCFRELREECGLKIDNPRNLKPRHVEALAKLWEGKEQSAATIQGKMSILRTLCAWIGKPGMITASADYVSVRAKVTRTYAATHDKGWRAAGLDVDAVLKQIALIDPYAAMQLEVIATFGMRRKEGVMFDPFLADQGQVLLIDRGTKGNRPRFAMIDSDRKRAVVEKAKAFVSQYKGGKGHIGDPARNLKQSLDRYSNVLKRIGITKEFLGVTGHGLRAEFVCDRLEEQGVIAPVRSKNGRQESSLSRHDQRFILKRISEEVGHSRTSVMSAYAGRFLCRELPDS